MENFSTHGKGLYKFDLPVGFRFHPTDAELISYYLSQKVLDNSFRAVAISEIDLNRCEPWDLPWRAKMGEAEWYFFCVRDRKYPTGLRTNRATDAGYWKATGKDKEIFKAKALIGMKKTLVFYKGRAPKGEKTNWVMHEYRLEGQLSKYNLPTPPKNEWVICRVFKKSKGGRKMQIRVDSSSELPPLMDDSPYNNNSFGTPNQIEFGESSHVTCFSDPNQMEDQKTQDDIVDSLETPILASSSCSIQTGNSQYPENFQGQEQFMMRMLMENPGSTNSITKPNEKANFSGERDFDADISSLIYNNNSSSNNNGSMVQKSSENQAYYSSAPTEPVDIGSLWNF